MDFEIEYLLTLQEMRGAAPDFVTSLLSVISAIAVSPIPILAVAIIMWCINKKAGFFIGFAYVVANGFIQVVKCAACINRPWILDSRVTPEQSAIADATGYSFPSGHTTLAGAIYGGIAYWFRKYKALVIAMVVLIVLTAFSRNWLGCHTPKDVLVALLVSFVCLFLSTKFFAFIEKHPERDVACAVIALAIGIAALAFISLKAYPLEYAADGALLVDPEDMKVDCFKSIGAYLGFFVAWIVDRRALNFSIEGTTRTRIIRGIVGAVVIGVIYLGILPVVTSPLGDQWGKFLKYFLLIICVGNLYPLCFTRFEAWLAKRR